MDYALLIDFEATGVDAKEALIIEIGAMLVKIAPYGGWSPVIEKSILVNQGVPLSDEVKKVTGISDQLLLSEGVSLEEAFMHLNGLSMQWRPECVIAYNRAYDETLFKSEAGRSALSMLPGINNLIHLPWLCAMADVETNYAFKSLRLAHVALEYGVTVNPKELHRAIGDVELTRKMLEAAGTTPAKMYEFQKVPWAYVEAVTQKPWLDGGRSTDLAKKRGFSWEQARGDYSGARFEKKWVKRIKEKDFELEQQAAQFDIKLTKENQ